MPRLARIPRTARWCAVAVLAGLGAWQGLRAQTPPATPAPAPATSGTAPAEPPTTPTVAPAADDSPTVRIVFQMSPAVNATVSWGRTRLGRTPNGRPLVVTRPRDSGPLDVVVRAPGYLTVHTRAHTFADTKLLVKLTPLDQKSTLLGYKAPLDAGMPLDPDAGVPPALSDMPPSLLYTPEPSPSMTPAQPATTPAPAPAPIAAPPPAR